MPSSLVRRPANGGFLWPEMLGEREMPEVDGLPKTWLAAFMKMVLQRWGNGRDKPAGWLPSLKL